MDSSSLLDVFLFLDAVKEQLDTFTFTVVPASTQIASTTLQQFVCKHVIRKIALEAYNSNHSSALKNVYLKALSDTFPPFFNLSIALGVYAVSPYCLVDKQSQSFSCFCGSAIGKRKTLKIGKCDSKTTKSSNEDSNKEYPKQFQLIFWN